MWNTDGDKQPADAPTCIIIHFACVCCTNSTPPQVRDGVPASLRRSQAAASLGRVPHLLHQQLHRVTVSHVTFPRPWRQRSRLGEKKPASCLLCSPFKLWRQTSHEQRNWLKVKKKRMHVHWVDSLRDDFSPRWEFAGISGDFWI